MNYTRSLSFALLTSFLIMACTSGSGDGDSGGSTAGTSGTKSSSGGSSGGTSSSSIASSSGGSSGGKSTSASSSTASGGGGASSNNSSSGGSSSDGRSSNSSGGSSSGGESSGGTVSTGGSSVTSGGTSAGGSGANSGAGGSGGSVAKAGNTGSGGTAAGGTSSAGGTSASGGSSGAGSYCDTTKAGVTINGKKRFMYGVNFAWSADNGAANFGTDFGGLVAWNKKGVAAAKAARTTDMTDMKNNGVDIIRWWMFPSMGATDGIKLDSNNSPTGLGGTMTDDINAALEIAASLDLHIKMTLFSFDNFKNDSTVGNVTSICIKPIIADDTKRAALIANVVAPLAKAVEASPNKDRMIAWDVINEPEWATSGNDGYGDQAFDPQSSLSSVPFSQMETFVKDVVTALHANSKAPVTVGSAAVKWAKAWSKVGLDFYDFHWYGWVDQYFPHTKTPKDYGVDDKPVVVGEFPLVPNADSTGQSFGGIKYGKLIDDWEAAGYAGAQGWAFSETQPAFSWANGKADVKAWANGKCYVHY